MLEVVEALVTLWMLLVSGLFLVLGIVGLVQWIFRDVTFVPAQPQDLE